MRILFRASQVVLLCLAVIAPCHGSTAWVATCCGSAIEGINLGTGETVGTIPIGEPLSNADALQIGPGAQRGILLQSNAIAEPDFRTRTIIGAARAPGVNSAVYVPGTNLAYALGGALNAPTSNLLEVNLKTGYTARKQVLPFNSYLVKMALSPDGKTLFVASTASDVLLIDTSSFQQIGTIPMVATAVATSPSEPSFLYLAIANLGAPQFEIWDTNTQSVVFSLPLVANSFAGYTRIQIVANGSRAYLVDAGGELACVNLKQGIIKWSVSVGDPVGFGVTPDGQTVAVTLQFMSSLYVFDGYTGNQIAVYPLSGTGGAVAVTQ